MAEKNVLACPKCRQGWKGGAKQGAYGQCSGCGTWLVADYPTGKVSGLRLYAYATRQDRNDMSRWIEGHDGVRSVAVECPFCGILHQHGTGKVGEPLDIGHRSARCGTVRVPRHGDVQLDTEASARGYYLEVRNDLPVAVPA